MVKQKEGASNKEGQKQAGYKQETLPEADAVEETDGVLIEEIQEHQHEHQHGHQHQADASEHCNASCRLPVLILTGYLGAGKTTLLNYILKEQSDKKLAVIENEIGEVSIDDSLVENKHQEAEELITLDNGCVCCTIRGDLVKALCAIAKKRDALDGVLIELTGMADPAPVVQTFFVHDEVRDAFYVDNVITLIDAKHCIERLDESKESPEAKGTASAQVAFASTVLLNKTDLVDPDQLKKVEQRLKGLNSTVQIIRCQQARVAIAKLFNVNAFHLARVLEEQYMDEDEFNQFYTPKMDHSVSNVGVRCTGALNMFKLQAFLSKYLEDEDQAKDFLRVKGVLEIKGSDSPLVLQCVQMLRNQGFGPTWPEGPRENRIIFIGRNMQPRREELTHGFLDCMAKPLRFAVGAKVQARMSEDHCENGHVVAHWDELHPYRIQLLDGSEVHARLDEDDYVLEGHGEWFGGKGE